LQVRACRANEASTAVTRRKVVEIMRQRQALCRKKNEKQQQ